MTTRFALFACLALVVSVLPAACGFTGSTCSNGVKNEDESDIDCGGSCGPCKAGKFCNAASDCQGAICTAGTCAAATCADGVKNGDETDVDCGGTKCSACASKQHCVTNGDCTTKYCAGAVCSRATCSDGIRNEDETDIDCGGLSCLPCNDGQVCASKDDCASGVCVGKRCTPATCTDQVQNGNETSVDCGGGCPCVDGSGCAKPEECLSLVCQSDVCQQASCSDGVANGAEGDIDCGGGCTLCADGKACNVGSDCTSGVCAGRVCQPPTCTDKVKNGATETDVDCGGTDCPPCADLLACGGPSDCQSGVCTGQVCQKPACGDLVKNGDETAKDCGGSCNPCADGLACLLGRDCASGVCSGTPRSCQIPSCGDGIKNGNETDVDCGGSLCGPCLDGKQCSANAGCVSGVCQSGTCRPASCGDGVKNASESDVDCGGSCAPCDNGKACGTSGECVTGACVGGTCRPWALAVPVEWSGAVQNPNEKVAFDAQGNIILSGRTSATILLGGTQIDASGTFLAKLSPDGSVVWARQVYTNFCGLSHVAVGPNGDIALQCSVGGNVNVSMHAGTDGVPRWSKVFAVATDDPKGIAVDSSGDVVFTGPYFASSVSFGGAPLTNSSGGAEARTYVVKLSGADGSHRWSKGFGESGTVTSTGIGVDAAGNPILVGWLSGTADFGGGLFSDTSAPGGGIFLAKLAAGDGSHLWSAFHQDSSSFAGSAVAVDHTGDVLLAVHGYAPLDFRGGPLSGAGELVVAKYAGTDGAHVWSRVLPVTQEPEPPRVAIDPAGNVVVANGFTDPTIDLGTGPIVNVGGNSGTADPFVAALAGATGTPLAARGYGSSGTDLVHGLAVGPNGDVLMLGYFENSINFGSGPLSPGPSPYTLYLASLGNLP